MSKFIFVALMIWPVVGGCKQAQLGLDDFRTRLVQIQSLSDQDQAHQAALDSFVTMRGRLRADSLQAEYDLGLEFSILWMGQRLKDKALIQEQITKILKRPNQRFIAIEYADSTSRPGILFRYWFDGFTHAHIATQMTLPDQLKREKDADKKAQILTEAALSGYAYAYTRLESSYGMSYGDRPVELLFADKSIPLETKYQALKALCAKLKGSAQGNAYYCLSVVSGRLKRIGEAKTYAKLGRDAFAQLDERIHHYHQMKKLCDRRFRYLNKKYKK